MTSLLMLILHRFCHAHLPQCGEKRCEHDHATTPVTATREQADSSVRHWIGFLYL